MDVADALSSYRTKEEKLAILKDPHIGAFAVIRLAVCGLVFIASLITLLASDEPLNLVMCTAAVFVLARSLSAVSVLTFRSAKNEGMLYYEASSAAGGRSVNLAFSFVWAALASALMVYYGKTAGIAGIAAAVLSFVWYKYKSYKEFGGITGDTAGYFVVICETASAAAAALAAVLVAV
jgi:adenosylcobinamide-GDP ribazoletransferase